MPHVIVKLWPGKSEDQKHRLAEAITKKILWTFFITEKSQCRWRWKKSNPRIGWRKCISPRSRLTWGLYKKPGYDENGL